MAVVDNADSEVVPELGVPGPISDGVTDSDGGGGKLIRVGVDILIALLDNQEMAKMNESDGKKKKKKN